MQTISTLLKSKKLKLTPQRLAIFNMLYYTDSHPTAEIIYNSLSESHPYMSLATVYKTLYSLREVGLVHEFNIGENSYRYDANCNHHMHFVCEECGAVVDLPNMAENIAEMKSLLTANTDFRINREELYFYGTCSECK